MFTKVHPPPVGDNKGSCAKLANYLDKEKDTAYFSHTEMNIPKDQVVNKIDGNTAQLRRKEDKFYMLSINPSQKELNHLLGRKVTKFEDLTKNEIAKLNTKLESYTRNVMNIYAQNFERENVKDGKDLIYFARIENTRKYHHYDKEVRNGFKKAGDLKEGLNVHVHVIVSRKSMDGRTKLSPNARSRGNSWNLNGTNATRGFNHVQFKIRCINKFNSQFNYASDFKTHNRISTLGKNVATSAATRPAAMVANKVKAQTGTSVTKHFRTELKIANVTARVGKFVASPKTALIQETIQAAKKIAFGLMDKGKGF